MPPADSPGTNLHRSTDHMSSMNSIQAGASAPSASHPPTPENQVLYESTNPEHQEVRRKVLQELSGGTHLQFWSLSAEHRDRSIEKAIYMRRRLSLKHLTYK